LNPERTRNAIARLSELVKSMATGHVCNVKDFERWSRTRDAELADFLGHARNSGLPPAHLLLKPFFHPKLPLVGLNYDKDTHKYLKGRHEGWTDALRYCRGTVFEWSSELIALPYAKFFNLYNHEHPEADNPPEGPYEATIKLDGHYGICFNYVDDWHLTTHGSFVSRSAKLGNELLLPLIQRSKMLAWYDVGMRDITISTEIIHPTTRIRCDYHGHQGLVLTGARDRTLFDDKDYAWLAENGPRLGLHVTDVWRDFTLDELRREVAEQKPKNREGFVLRWPDGTYGKLKYKHYMDRMSDMRLSYNGLMHAFIDGKLKSEMENIAEELWPYADDMWKKLEKARRMTDEKAARAYLYALVPPEMSKQYYRRLCREFLAHRS